jgi:hypothetical protein
MATNSNNDLGQGIWGQIRSVLSVISTNGDGTQYFNNDNSHLYFDFNSNQLCIGGPTFLANGNVLNVIGNLNGSAQINVQNLNAGTASSADHVMTANNGNDTTNYVDLGINSSTYNQAAYNIVGALAGYLYTNGGDLGIGTATASKVVKFHTGGTTTTQLRLTLTDTNATFTVPIITPNVFEGYSTVVTAASTTTLTSVSPYVTYFTGTLAQTITLPVATTMVVGQQFLICNRSTTAITINSSGASLVQTLNALSNALITCVIASGTDQTSWDSFSTTKV